MLASPRSILLIEDHPDVVDLLSMLLENAGFRVEQVDTFDGAEASLRRQAFDVVLSDFRLGAVAPEDAWRRLEGVRQLAAPAPVALYSGWALDADEVAERGFAFFQLKGCTSEALLVRLSGALELAPVGDVERAVVQDYFHALEQGAWFKLAALCSEDVVYHLPGDDPRFCRTVTGRLSFVRYAEETFRSFREPRFEVVELRSLPHAVIARYIGRFLTEGDDTPKESPGSVVFEFRDDLIVRIGVRVDLATLR
jgi:ketosteroid isomerase-like protein